MPQIDGQVEGASFCRRPPCPPAPCRPAHGPTATARQRRPGGGPFARRGKRIAGIRRRTSGGGENPTPPTGGGAEAGADRPSI